MCRSAAVESGPLPAVWASPGEDPLARLTFRVTEGRSLGRHPDRQSPDGRANPEHPNQVGVVTGDRESHNGLMTTTEKNKITATEFIDALFTRGDLDAVDEYLAEDFVNNDPPFGATADREGMRSAAALFRSVFPDWHSDLHLLVAEGDIVVNGSPPPEHTPAHDHGGRPFGRHCVASWREYLPPARRTDRRALGQT